MWSAWRRGTSSCQQVRFQLIKQIIIAGEFLEIAAKAALDRAWQQITQACQEWIEQHLPDNYR